MSVYPECGKGWATLYEPVLALAEKQGVSVNQVKEKWGRLRIYTDGGDEALDALIDAAEVLSAHVCETCGRPGAVRPSGWVKTLCDACYEGKA